MIADVNRLETKLTEAKRERDEYADRFRRAWSEREFYARRVAALTERKAK